MPSRLRDNTSQLLSKLGPLLGLVAVWLLFAVVEGAIKERPTFATWSTTQTILLQTAVVGVAALGGTMIIISGGIDLSVGSLIALGTVVFAFVANLLIDHASGMNHEVITLSAAAATIALATLCGLAIGGMVIGRIGRVASLLAVASGGLIAYRYGLTGWQGWTALGLGAALGVAAWIFDRRLKPPLVMSPFIVTLGMLGALRGAAKGLANNQTIYAIELDTALVKFMQPPKEFGAATLWRPWQWWSPGVWVFIVLAVLVALVLRYTQFGRHLYAIGSNEQTARLCGVPVERTKLKVYTVALALAGIAGVLQFSYLDKCGDPNTAVGYELKVIAAAVIGGASLSGGVGGVLGTVAGALMMTTIETGCTKLDMQNWTQEIITGGIIVAAVALDKLRHRGEQT